MSVGKEGAGPMDQEYRQRSKGASNLGTTSNNEATFRCFLQKHERPVKESMK